MRLAALIANAELRRVSGDTECEISGLAYDSRQVQPGDFFFATARDQAQRRANIEQALQRGARALALARWAEEEARPAVATVECERPRVLMALAASRFFNAPSRRLDLIGITGTSGKTTTSYLLESIFSAAGRPCGLIGTIGILAAGRQLYRGLTTPESVDFEAALATMERARLRTVVAEISSIGLAERRVDQLSFRACLFTNFGRDHLDYHGTLENYFAAKLRLFTELLPASSHPAPVAIVRGDDAYGARVLKAVAGASLSFGLDRRLDVHPASFASGLDGIRATVEAAGQRFDLRSPLLGEINLLNILAASAVSVALGIETDAVVEGVRRCPGAPGRLEPVPAPAGVKILVDYAHKPDALAAVLQTLRALAPRRLICVFGCGGDRDRGKRPIMGEIAGRQADLAVLTSDNPRSEEPLAIIAEVEHGLRRSGLPRLDAPTADGVGYLVEPERRRAIALALGAACAGDIVLIAGKGHEDYQLVGSRRLAFDDRVVVRELVGAMRAG